MSNSRRLPWRIHAGEHEPILELSWSYSENEERPGICAGQALADINARSFHDQNDAGRRARRRARSRAGRGRLALLEQFRK